MKKYIIVALFAFLQFDVSAQTLIPLHVDNSEPRVGETITLSFNVSFLIETIKAQSKDSLQFVANSMGYQSRNDKLLSTVQYESVGNHIIGPFKFSFNEIEYVTDSVEVNVIPSLPNKEGLWIRKVVENGVTYVIIEQNIIKVSKRRSKKKTQKKYSKDKSSKMEAALITSPEEGLTFRRKLLSVSSSSLDFGNVGGRYMAHYYTKFEVTLTDNYKLNGELKPEYFENLPNDFVLEKIYLK